MTMQLKPIEEQVVVITGASSGIGLTTARMAAARGARVVLAGRNAAALRQAVGEIRARAGAALHVTADVSRPEDVERVAEAAMVEWGRFDTWVNNAGVAIYGRIDEVSLEDARRLFDVNFWGVVHGSRAALPLLRERGGALINVGSMVSDRAVPLQGYYVASKHAVKGFTDALRMELEEAGAPVSVTLVKPAGIATPFFEHAMNYMDTEPVPPPPVYAPETVARAILTAAQRPVRDIIVGGAARTITSMAATAPRITDRVMERTMFGAQQGERRTTIGNESGNLYETVGDRARERGEVERRVFERSAYTQAALNPGRTALLALGVGVAVAAGLRAARRGS